MLPLLRRLAVARAAAVLVMFTTSGVAHAGPDASVGPHRCTCSARGEDHVCACRVCDAAARRAREALAEDLPPCHRAAAREVLAAADVGTSRVPSLLPTCGVPPWASAVAAAAEPFPLPATPLFALAEWSVCLDAHARAGPDLALVPETPPPRR